MGWKTCVTSSPEEIAGKTVCHERTTAAAERPSTSSVEPSSIPDGGKRRKINESARQESTVEIIILTLHKKGRSTVDVFEVSRFRRQEYHCFHPSCLQNYIFKELFSFSEICILYIYFYIFDFYISISSI